jgi:nucleotide-binding universal stress UspA family protein
VSRRILVALDNSENAVRVVTYVARLVGGRKGIEITLFHVLPGLPPEFVYVMDERKAVEEWEEKNRREMADIFSEAQKILIQTGIPKENVITKMKPLVKGVARDILSEAKEGSYRTIVLGRRGMSAIEEFFLGSVSNKVIHHAKNCTVWVVE